MLILRWLKFKPTFNLSKNNCRNLSAKCKVHFETPENKKDLVRDPFYVSIGFDWSA